MVFAAAVPVTVTPLAPLIVYCLPSSVVILSFAALSASVVARGATFSLV